MAVSMTFNAAGNVRSSSTLAASATASGNLDYSAKIEGQVTVRVDVSSSVAATRGLRVQFFPRYGSTPADSTLSAHGDTLPCAAISSTEVMTFFLGSGKWKWQVTNLDAVNALAAVEITDATVDGV